MSKVNYTFQKLPGGVYAMADSSFKSVDDFLWSKDQVEELSAHRGVTVQIVETTVVENKKVK